MLNSTDTTDPLTSRELPPGPISSAYDEPWNPLRSAMESPAEVTRQRNVAGNLRMQMQARSRTSTFQAPKSIMSVDTGHLVSDTRSNKSVVSMDTGRDEADDRESSQVP